MPTATPISILGEEDNLPNSLKHLISLRLLADSTLNSVELEQELRKSELPTTPSTIRNRVLNELKEILSYSAYWQDSKLNHSKLTKDHLARGLFIKAWTLGRMYEFDGTAPEEIVVKLKESLKIYQECSDLLNLPPPPELNSVPSITRRNSTVQIQAPINSNIQEQENWVGEFLAEFARTQTTLTFSSLLLTDSIISEELLSDLLELSCRRNVQCLFTPLSSDSSSTTSADPASTIMGNCRLIKDMLSAFPFSTSSTSIWYKRISFAVHVADVEFVQASMSAERLVEAASLSATILQNQNLPTITTTTSSSTTSTSSSTRQSLSELGKKEPNKTVDEVRVVLEATLRRLVPFEKKQAATLLGLGRVMLEAIGAIYLGKKEGGAAKSSTVEGEEEEVEIVVPENDLVREARQVFIRAAGLFENAYASSRHQQLPSTPNSRKEEIKLLRRLETTYVLLEELDNSTPEVQALRSDRVDRALWINDRLIELGDIDEENVEGDEDDDEEGYESDDYDGYGSGSRSRRGEQEELVSKQEKAQAELESGLGRVVL